MRVTTSEVPRIAGAIRLAGELFEAHGALMLDLTSDWEHGPKAANLDPDQGGNRWELCGDVMCTECPHAKPSDPTGEAAIAQARADAAVELHKRLTRLVEDAQWLRDMAHVLAPIVPPSTLNDKDDRWCTNHLRIGLAEPRYRGEECRTCYDFRLMWKIPQPPMLMRERHLRSRVSDKMVKQALEAEGLLLSTVGGVTKAVRQARKPNQNERKRKAAS